MHKFIWALTLTIVCSSVSFAASVQNVLSAPNKKVLITEIFADPSPGITLPAAEFIELYNRSAVTINLAGWTISDGISTAGLLNQDLAPGGYLILTATSSAEAYSQYGVVMGISKFPALNNDKDALVLRSADGILVDSVYYADSWYRNSDKKEGGWSLELIDTENTCAEEENWIASEDSRGGTPGQENSVKASKPDLAGPMLLSVLPVTATQMVLAFNEKLAEEALHPEDVHVTPAIQVIKISFHDLSLNQLDVTLASGLDSSVLYTIHVSDIRDCAGNSIQESYSSQRFALPQQADSLDIIINEVLFNPFTGGVDFVEIYNRSQKYIDLNDWSIANLTDQPVANTKTIATQSTLLEPSTYKVLTPDTEILKGQYPAGNENTFLKMSLPSMPDDEGSVALVNDKGSVIDGLWYNNEMHSPFIEDDEGISLERVSFSAPTHERNNWKSASTTAGYATPGYLNSNARPDVIVEEAITIDPEIFQPLYGQPDFTSIRYKFDHGGFVANVRILDAQGRTIRLLANNEILGTEGFYRWDGDRDDGGKARIGYYVVWFEVFDSSGIVKTYRKRVVVAGR